MITGLKNKSLIGAIVMIGIVIFAIESMKSPDRARGPVAGADIPIEQAIHNQQTTGTSAFSCTNGRCSSTTDETPSGNANSPFDLPVAGEQEAQTARRVVEKAKQFERAKEIMDPHGFINLPEGKTSLTLAELVGRKVIIVDFWTYSCINCQRTTPYLNAWYDKYRDQGLEIVGVHTPEFSFEKDIENVREATARLGIKYPVVLDNAYATWGAYRNRFWPHKYLIDIDGFIVDDHIGEGGYEETEQQIQRALAERALVLGLDRTIASGTVNPNLGADTPPVGGAISPETYFGAARNEFLANGNRGVIGEQALSPPESALTNVRLNALYLFGIWNFYPEYAENKSAEAKIFYRYSAKNVYFVASSEAGVKIKLLRDGKPLTPEEAGEDVKIENGDAVATITEDRLYKLIKETSTEEHMLEIIIESPGLKAFTFTFG